MKIRLTGCFQIVFILFMVMPLWLAAQTGRNTLLFNSNWKFHKGDVAQGETAAFADQNWQSVDLPHDWSIAGPFSEEWASGTAFLPGGIGWYRKTFTVPSSIRNKNVFIYFDGVYNNSEVWINGHYLGKRPNGFVSFQYELTPYLKSGENILAVKVDHSQFADSRWYTGSGIYRDVYLVAKAPVHIPLWGVNFTTPKVSAAMAKAEVLVKLNNNSLKSSAITVTCKLLNAAGNTVATGINKLSVNKTDSSSTKVAFTVKNPLLWSVNDPHLYNLVVSIASNGKTTDEVRTKVGIRSINFDADKGFFLNGINLKLKGVCLHDDAGALGVAVPREVWYRRLELLKAAGCNSIRMSHNPHASYFYDLCDKLGLLVMDEAFDEWEAGKNKWVKGRNVGTASKNGYNEHFKDWYDKDVRDMILRDRIHPCIIMWSIGNEIDYPNDPYTDTILNTGRNPQIYGRGYAPGHPLASRLGELSKQLVDVVKKYDTTRPVTAALAGVVMSNNTTFPANMDVVGYNYQEFRYQDDHKAYPKRVIYGSENGMQLSAWNAVDSNAYIAGQFLWTGIDYLGEANRFPSRSSGAGLLDLAGFPKPEYYFRQSLWSAKPMAYLTTAVIKNNAGSDQNQLRRQAKPTWNYQDNDSVRVNCFTNCDEAELFLNNVSLGRKRLSAFTNKVIYWDVSYKPGVLTVKGYLKGKNISNNSLTTAGEPYAVTVGTDLPLEDRQSGLSQIVIRVVDQQGIPVYNANNLITVSISGEAKLLGLESGSLNSVEDYKSSSRKALNGKLLAYVQAKDKTPVKVIITSPGLKTSVFQIR